MFMKSIELESSLTPFICTHFWFVYVMRSAALNSPDYAFPPCKRQSDLSVAISNINVIMGSDGPKNSVPQ